MTAVHPKLGGSSLRDRAITAGDARAVFCRTYCAELFGISCLALVVLISGGCGRGIAVGPKKNVVPGDFIGTWQYSEDRPSVSVEIRFDPNGTFHQVVSGSGAPRETAYDGKWRIENDEVHLDGVLVYTTKWETTMLGWPVVIDSNGRCAIVGGVVPDPDSDRPFRKIQ
jgi:hypothetical protein